MYQFDCTSQYRTDQELTWTVIICYVLSQFNLMNGIPIADVNFESLERSDIGQYNDEAMAWDRGQLASPCDGVAGCGCRRLIVCMAGSVLSSPARLPALSTLELPAKHVTLDSSPACRLSWLTNQTFVKDNKDRCCRPANAVADPGTETKWT